MEKEAFFMVTQETNFIPDIFYDKNFEDLDKDVFNFTTENYLPLTTNPKS